MNSSINMTSSSPQKTNEPVVSSSAKKARDGENSTETGDLAASAKSFHDSIKDAYDESKTANETDDSDKADKEPNGKDLPEDDNFPKLSAQDDRTILPAGLYLNGQLAANDKSKGDATQALPALSEIDTDISDADLELLANSLNTDKKAITDGKLSDISPQIRQLLNAENANTNKKLQSARSAETTSSSKTADGGLIVQADTLTLKTELAGLIGDKVQAFVNASGQQLSTPNTQTSSLLLQAASAQIDAGEGASPLTGSTPTTNLQTTLPPAGITEAFGKPAWAQGMGKQILMMVNQNISTAEIRLNPSNLGPIEVFIDMSDDQVTVSLSSRHANVRDAMEQALPRLREMLEQNGFSLADADISKHSFAEQREQGADNGKKGIVASKLDQAVTTEMSSQVMKQTAMSTSMVDYYI